MHRESGRRKPARAKHYTENHAESGAMIASLPMPAVCFDPASFDLIHANAAFTRLLGGSDGVPLAPGTGSLHAAHADDRDALRATRLAAIESGEPWQADYRLPGGTSWVRESGVVSTFGERRMAVAVLVDISDQARLSRIFDEAPECIKLINPDGRMRCMNRTGLELIGATDASALSGESLLDLVVPEQRDAFSFYLQEVAAGRSRDPYEFEIVTADGARRWMETRMVPFRDGADAVLLGITRDVSTRKRAEEVLIEHSFYDGLTRLPNRRSFLQRIEQAMAEADRRERLACVMFLDLDYFKRVNDTLGHEAGDELIRAVAGRLQTCLRGGDTVARLSGDEFGFVLADVGHVDDGTHVALRIMEQLRAPFTIAGHQLRVTASVGMTYYPMDDSPVEGLLKHADAAMYRAKAQGRNTFEVYGWEMSSSVKQRVSLEQKLRHALEHDEINVVYQPTVSLATGRIIGAEALARWLPAGGVEIAAQEFIPIAEDGLLIVAIGARARAETFRLSAHLAARLAPPAPFRISINLSAREIEDTDFLTMLQHLSAETNATPAMLGFEISESVLMQDTARIAELLASLRMQGFVLAVDRFGSGHTNLTQLRRLPVHALNISPDIVRDIATDPNATTVAKAAIGLAHDFGLRAVAKGVETQAQRDMLRTLDCDEAQGNFFGRPVTAATLESLLRHDAKAAG